MEPVAQPRRRIFSSREHLSETLEVLILRIVPSYYPEKPVSGSLNMELTCFNFFLNKLFFFLLLLDIFYFIDIHHIYTIYVSLILLRM